MPLAAVFCNAISLSSMEAVLKHFWLVVGTVLCLTLHLFLHTLSGNGCLWHAFLMSTISVLWVFEYGFWCVCCASSSLHGSSFIHRHSAWPLSQGAASLHLRSFTCSLISWWTVTMTTTWLNKLLAWLTFPKCAHTNMLTLYLAG